VAEARRLDESAAPSAGAVTFGVFAPCDPRIDAESRTRAGNIVRLVAELVADRVCMPDGSPVEVVWSPVLVDGEKQADLVARQFLAAGVQAIICVPDTWAFPQLTTLSLLAHFPDDVPLNITCRLAALNVGTWPDTGAEPEMTPATADALVDWCYAALTRAGLVGKRVVVFGHDSMGMETALAHVLATRRTFGLEITRLDMKLLADMLGKKAYDAKELQDLRAWIDKHVGDRLDLSQDGASEKFNQGLALYLVMRDLMAEVGAVGGGFMNQLEWGSDRRGLPLPICDVAESLFNSTFDHRGAKPALPFATEADVQGLLTMLVMTWLSGGNPPLFMDFRKVWEPWEICRLAESLGVPHGPGDVWAERGLVDGDNSGSASLNWAGRPGDSPEACLKNVSMPGAELYYFPGGGNSVTFISPGGIEGIAGRMAYSTVTGCFSLVWDEAATVDLPPKLAQAVANASNVTWPHTWVVPKYASMAEYKQVAPANHFHMIWNLPPARLQHWMDLANVLSVAPWQARPAFIEGTDRPVPLLHLLNGGENVTKIRLAGR